MIQGEIYKHNNDMYSTFSDVCRSLLVRRDMVESTSRMPSENIGNTE